MKLEEFKDLISVTDYKMCESKMENNPIWFFLTLDIFVKFLYKVIFLFIFIFPFDALSLYSSLFFLERVIQFGGYRNKVVLGNHFQSSQICS